MVNLINISLKSFVVQWLTSSFGSLLTGFNLIEYYALLYIVITNCRLCADAKVTMLISTSCMTWKLETDWLGRSLSVCQPCLANRCLSQ